VRKISALMYCFLADRTKYGRAIATLLRLSVVCTICIGALYTASSHHGCI